jgi:hypothetical protein
MFSPPIVRRAPMPPTFIKESGMSHKLSSLDESKPETAAAGNVISPVFDTLHPRYVRPIASGEVTPLAKLMKFRLS